jgi:hypothetical protein
MSLSLRRATAFGAVKKIVVGIRIEGWIEIHEINGRRLDVFS